MATLPRTLAARLFAIDARAVGVLRILQGLLLLACYLIYLPDVETFYSDAGLLPRELLLEIGRFGQLPSLHLASGGVGFQLLLFAIAGVAALCLLVGYQSRAAAFVSWVLLVSLCNRNPFVFSGNVILKISIFWCLFLPLGARYSVDAWLRGARLHAPAQVLSVGSAVYLLRIAFIFVVAGLGKWYEEIWHDGSAVVYALNQSQLAHGYADWLLQFPALLRGITLLVPYAELLGGLLLFLPAFTPAVRMLLFVGMAFMLMNFKLAFGLDLLAWSGIVALVPFLPPAFWDRAERLVRAASGRRPLGPLERLREALRSRAGVALAGPSPPARPAWWGALVGVVAVSLLMLVFARSLAVFHPALSGWIPRPAVELFSFLGLNRRFNMFSSLAPRRRHVTAEGILRDRSRIDLLAEPPFANGALRLPSDRYRNHAWRKWWQFTFSRRSAGESQEALSERLAQHLCGERNAWAREQGDVRIRGVAFVVVSQNVLSDGRRTRLREHTVSKHRCR